MLRKLGVVAVVAVVVLLGAPSVQAECELWSCWRISPDRGECRLSFNFGNLAYACRAVYDCPPWNPDGPCGVWCEYDQCYEV